MHINSFLKKNIGIMLSITDTSTKTIELLNSVDSSGLNVVLVDPDISKTEVESCTITEISRKYDKMYKKLILTKGQTAVFYGSVIRQLFSNTPEISVTNFDYLSDLYSKYSRAVLSKETELIVFSGFNNLFELRAAIISFRQNFPDLPIASLFSFENEEAILGKAVAYFEIAEALNVDYPGLILHRAPSQNLYEMLNEYNLPRGLSLSALIDFDETENKITECVEKLVNANTRLIGFTPDRVNTGKKILPLRDRKLDAQTKKELSFSVTGRTSTVFIGENHPFVIIGERINPTNRRKLVNAIEGKDLEFILKEAKTQLESGADCLDLNFGVPGLDQSEIMADSIVTIQNNFPNPLFIDSTDISTIDNGLKVYQGKGIVNSINGKEEIYEKILPIVKKFGASVVILAIDKTLPGTTPERVKIVEKMVRICEEYGIGKNRIVIDPAVLSVATNPDAPSYVLETIKIVKEEFQLPLIVGLSNVSFGLPNRKLLNRTFLIMAMQAGLDGAILNPLDKDIHDYIAAASVFVGRDKNFKNYIRKFRKVEIDFDF